MKELSLPVINDEVKKYLINRGAVEENVEKAKKLFDESKLKLEKIIIEIEEKKFKLKKLITNSITNRREIDKTINEILILKADSELKRIRLIDTIEGYIPGKLFPFGFEYEWMTKDIFEEYNLTN